MRIDGFLDVGLRIALLDIPGVKTRIALLDIPGTDSEAPVRVFLHGLGSSSIATFPAISSHPALHNARSILIDLAGFSYEQRYEQRFT